MLLLIPTLYLSLIGSLSLFLLIFHYTSTDSFNISVSSNCTFVACLILSFSFCCNIKHWDWIVDYFHWVHKSFIHKFIQSQFNISTLFRYYFMYVCLLIIIIGVHKWVRSLILSFCCIEKFRTVLLVQWRKTTKSNLLGHLLLFYFHLRLIWFLSKKIFKASTLEENGEYDCYHIYTHIGWPVFLNFSFTAVPAYIRSHAHGHV